MKDVLPSRRPATLLAIALSVLALAACGRDPEEPDLETQLSQPAVVETEPTGCPEVLIVGDAGTIVHFAPGAARNSESVQAAGRIVDFSGTCDYFDDGVRMYMNLLIVAERGPAYQGGALPFDYFVGVLRPNDERFGERLENQLQLAFAEGPQNGAVEELELWIPLTNLGAGREYRVVMGFELTPEQLEFNRSEL